MHFYNKQLVWFNTTVNISPTVIGCGHDTDSSYSSPVQINYAKSPRMLGVHFVPQCWGFTLHTGYFVEPHGPLHRVNRATGIFFFCLSLTAAEAADPATGTQSEDLRGGLHWSPQDAASTGHADNTVPSAGRPEMGDRRGTESRCKTTQRGKCYVVQSQLDPWEGGRAERCIFSASSLVFRVPLFLTIKPMSLCPYPNGRE